MSITKYILDAFRVIILVLTGSLSLSGQSLLEMPVSVSYQQTPLEEAFFDLKSRYQIPFSYSSDLIEVGVEVDAVYQHTPLGEVLESILKGTGIAYSEMSGMIVLRDDSTKRETLLSSHEAVGPELEEPLNVIFPGTPPWKDPNVVFAPVPVALPTSVERMPRKVHRPQPDWALLDSIHFAGQKGPAILQASILPYLGNYMEDSDKITANLSMNLIWGVTGGVTGAEFGLMVNVTKGKMQGAQFAGITNVVTGPVHGLQVAGGINVAEDRTVGLQLAGVSNYSRLHTGVQIATFMNVTAWRATGLQIGGFMNVAGGRNSVVAQFSGLLNVTKGDALWQASSLLNVASEVHGGQVAMINIGGEVQGFQLGLINIADTVSGPTIGLLNFVKRGYNRFDLSSSEVFWGQTGFALGSPHFYNLIQFGYRGSDGRANASWALGYGIGTRLSTWERWLSNFEVMAWHVNEEALWTSEMNWLGQVRINFEKYDGAFRHLYFGPVLNVSASRVNSGENGIMGTKLAPYNFLPDQTNSNTSLKAWVGVNAGFRF